MADVPARVRRVAPADPGGEPTCLLTSKAARARRAPIDRLLDDGTFSAAATGYEVRLPRDEEHWLLANAFAEEEAVCCPSLGLEIEERGDEIVVRAAF